MQFVPCFRHFFLGNKGAHITNGNGVTSNCVSLTDKGNNVLATTAGRSHQIGTQMLQSDPDLPVHGRQPSHEGSHHVITDETSTSAPQVYELSAPQVCDLSTSQVCELSATHIINAPSVSTPQISRLQPSGEGSHHDICARSGSAPQVSRLQSYNKGSHHIIGTQSGSVLPPDDGSNHIIGAQSGLVHPPDDGSHLISSAQSGSLQQLNDGSDPDRAQSDSAPRLCELQTQIDPTRVEIVYGSDEDIVKEPREIGTARFCYIRNRAAELRYCQRYQRSQRNGEYSTRPSV